MLNSWSKSTLIRTLAKSISTPLRYQRPPFGIKSVHLDSITPESTEPALHKKRLRTIGRDERPFITVDDNKLRLPELPLKTKLHDFHIENDATMVQYHQWRMPLHYGDMTINESALWTRSKASIFDVSHMMHTKIKGDDAVAFLQQCTPSDIQNLEVFKSVYTTLLTDRGDIVDDAIITNLTKEGGPPQYVMVTNASTWDSVIPFILSQRTKANLPSVTALPRRLRSQIGLIALQGPLAASVLQKMIPLTTVSKGSGPFNLSTLYFGSSIWLRFRLEKGKYSSAMLVSRTGYTGEDGFEIYIEDKKHPENRTEQFTRALIKAGAGDVRMAGLGARDLLRLEAGLCLSGVDMNTSTTPLEARIGWIIPASRKSETATFNGARHLYGFEATAPQKVRVGIVMDGPSVPRADMTVYANDEKIGTVTSGAPSPTLGKSIAMAMVSPTVKVGNVVQVEIRGKKRQGILTKMPFVETKYYKQK